MGIRRTARGAGRLVGCAGLVVAFMAAATTLHADDGSSFVHDLASSADFRVRVSAALQVGRSKPAGAREALEEALSDSHPAVRLAAAEALGALGELAAVPALQDHLVRDPSVSVRAQIRATVDRLRGGSSVAGDGPAHTLGTEVRCVVVLGTMRNPSGIRGDELRQVLSDAARARVQALHGVLLSEADGPLLHQAAAKHVPVVVLDGSVSAVSESSADGNVQVRARVEFTVRRDQALKGTVSGAAITFGSGPKLSEPGRRRLQDDAVSGAVQSALRGADQGLIVAAR
jgi:HEAT repeats